MLSLALVSLALAAEPIRVTPGTQTVIKVPGVTRVAIGQQAIADVRPTGRGELLITGNQLGRTSMTLWFDKGAMQTRTIVVDDERGSEIGRMVKELVNPALRVGQFNGYTVIDGHVDSIDELRRLEVLLSSEPNVKILATLDPRVMPAVAENINVAFRKNGLTSAKAVAMGAKIVLEGSVADERELERALLIANTYAAGSVVARR